MKSQSSFAIRKFPVRLVVVVFTFQLDHEASASTKDKRRSSNWNCYAHFIQEKADDLFDKYSSLFEDDDFFASS